jgi:soluble lytic murein transglycosylase
MMRRRLHRIGLAAGAALLLVGAAMWRDARSVREFECRFDPLIIPIAGKYGIDPCLVRAVIWRESRFDPSAAGTSGERGLMQIMPMAASDWAVAEKRRDYQPDRLYDPEINIRENVVVLLQKLHDTLVKRVILKIA